MDLHLKELDSPHFEPEFTNREIRAMFGGVMTKLEEHGDTHAEILTQVRATNGRVSALEHWQDRIIGGMAVLTLIVIPLLGWAMWRLANLDHIIQGSIDEALSAYNIEP